MALQKTISLTTNFDTQVTFDNAYIRVDGVNVKKGFSQAFVFTHKEKDGQILQKKNYVFDYDLNGVNPISQAYQHLKKLPEFVDAVDC
jgi:hypothetical protein